MVFWVLIEVFCGVIRMAIACEMMLGIFQVLWRRLLERQKKFILRHILACCLGRYSQGQLKVNIQQWSELGLIKDLIETAWL
jgi:hypothetical protein